MDAKEAASRLNEIAEWIEKETRDCITYTDIRAANQTAKPNIAIAIHKIIRSGLAGSNLSGIASTVAQRNGRSVNWHGVRVAFGFEGADWLSEFDSDTAPPHSEMEFPSCEQIETDRTADELREWYRRQSLAWSRFLCTIASRLEVGQVEPDREEQTPVVTATSRQGGKPGGRTRGRPPMTPKWEKRYDEYLAGLNATPAEWDTPTAYAKKKFGAGNDGSNTRRWFKQIESERESIRE